MAPCIFEHMAMRCNIFVSGGWECINKHQYVLVRMSTRKQIKMNNVTGRRQDFNVFSNLARHLCFLPFAASIQLKVYDS